MHWIVKRVGYLILPILLVFIVLFAIYGVEGPPDGPRSEQIGRAIGETYGIYLSAVVGYWTYRSVSQKRK